MKATILTPALEAVLWRMVRVRMIGGQWLSYQSYSQSWKPVDPAAMDVYLANAQDILQRSTEHGWKLPEVVP